MAVDLFYLANNLTDQEFVKLIISSGDRFPGFYRFTMGNRGHEQKQLSLKGLLTCHFDQTFNNKKYTKEQWTMYTKEKHKSLDVRNSSRSDSSVYEFLDRSYLKWMADPKEYDIALIEIDSVVNKINLGQTYFFMGSLIRFEEDCFKIGFDLLRDESVLTIETDMAEIIEYTEKIYGRHLKDFFLLSDCVASLNIEEYGTLTMSEDTISRTVLADNNSIVIASNRDVSKNLPIRWAKDILLTEVSEL